MSNLKPEEKKLHKAINKAMKDDSFYDTILEAAQAKQISQLQAELAKYRWIPVSELPKVEKVQKYVVRVKWDASTKPTVTWQEDKWSPFENCWQKWNRGNVRITHYMPIILPPEKEGVK